MKRMSLLVILTIVFALMVGVKLANAAPGTLYVDAAGGCGGNLPCYQHPQDAVNAANPGDTILVYPGTYTERVFTSPNPPHQGLQDQYAPPLIVWKDNLTIKAIDPVPANTVIQATQNYYFEVNPDMGSAGGGSIEHSTGCAWNSVTQKWDGTCVRPRVTTPPNAVDIIASGVTLEGFTIRRFHDSRLYYLSDAVRIGGLYAGYGIHGESVGFNNNTIRGCIIEDSDKSAITIWHSSGNIIEDNIIRRITWRAIQIYDGSSDAEVSVPNPSQNNIIRNNDISAAWGGISVGAWNQVGPNMIRTNNSGTTIAGNNLHDLTAEADIGISFQDQESSGIIIENNTINLAGSSPTNHIGSIGIWSIRNTTFHDLKIVGNKATSGTQNGFQLEGLIGGQISNNEVANWPLQGIALSNSQATILANNNTHDNGYAGILLISTTDVDVHDNLINHNTLTPGLPAWGDKGGGFTLWTGVTNTRVHNNTINQNVVDGVYISSDAGDGNIFWFNNIVGNGFGMRNDSDTVLAENNWWGDPSGPYNATSNPAGSGNGANDTVDFRPWITGLSYTGKTVFPSSAPAVLQARLVNSDGQGLTAPVPNIKVEFFANGNSKGIATSDANGVVKLSVSLPAGVYDVRAVVRGGGLLGDCLIGLEAKAFVAVFDPKGGFVTGGGWIMSPAGAYAANPTIAGKATFEFASKYLKGATVPSGDTEFKLKVGDLNFHSTRYEWLAVAGAKAMFKGVGTINGKGKYGFMLTAIDGKVRGGGGVDKFRIKIWDMTTSAVIYDNQMGAGDAEDVGTVLGGGSIVIHKP